MPNVVIESMNLFTNIWLRTVVLTMFIVCTTFFTFPTLTSADQLPTLSRFVSPFKDFSILMPAPLQMASDAGLKNGNNNFRLEKDGQSFLIYSYKTDREFAASVKDSFEAQIKVAERQGYTLSSSENMVGSGWSGKISCVKKLGLSSTSLFAVPKGTRLMYIVSMSYDINDKNCRRMLTSFTIDPTAAVKAHLGEEVLASDQSSLHGISGMFQWLTIAFFVAFIGYQAKRLRAKKDN